MKAKLLATAALGIFLSQTAFAKELDVGSIEVFGNSSLSSSNEKATQATTEATTKTTEIDAGALYYVQKNIGVGLHFLYSKEDKSNNFSPNDSTLKLTLISPGAAYNLSIDEGSSVSFLLALAGLIKGEVSSQSGGNPTATAKVSGQILQISYKKFFNPHVSLNAGVTKSSTKAKPDDGSPDVDYKTTEFFVGLSTYF